MNLEESFSLLLARSVGAGGCVYAFEPDPVNFQILHANVKANGYQDTITIRQQGAGDMAGNAILRVFEKNRGLQRLWGSDHDGKSVSVPIVILDEVPELFKNQLSFVKVDTEGWEQHVLIGMQRLLARNPDAAILSEFTPDFLRKADSDPIEFLRLLTANGGRLYELDDNERRVHAITARELMDTERRQGFLQTNLLCIRGKRDLPPRAESC